MTILSFLIVFLFGILRQSLCIALTVLELGICVWKLHVVSDPPAPAVQVMVLQKCAVVPGSCYFMLELGSLEHGVCLGLRVIQQARWLNCMKSPQFRGHVPGSSSFPVPKNGTGAIDCVCAMAPL